MLRIALAVGIAGLVSLGLVRAQNATQGSTPPDVSAQDLLKDAPAADATAKDPQPGENFRYTFYRAKEGFIRLDGQTGQVSQCGWGSVGWSCNAIGDERAALDNEIGRLQAENAALKKVLLSNSLELPNGMKAEPLAQAPEPPPYASSDVGAGPQLPTRADLERVMAFVEKVWKRMVEMMATLQQDMQRKS